MKRIEVSIMKHKKYLENIESGTLPSQQIKEQNIRSPIKDDVIWIPIDKKKDQIKRGENNRLGIKEKQIKGDKLEFQIADFVK